MLLEILSSQIYPRLKPLFPSLFFVISLNIKRSDITNILRPLGPVLPVCVNRSSNVTLESKLPSLTIKIYSIHSTEPVQKKERFIMQKKVQILHIVVLNSDQLSGSDHRGCNSGVLP